MKILDESEIIPLEIVNIPLVSKAFHQHLKIVYIVLFQLTCLIQSSLLKLRQQNIYFTHEIK